MQRKLFLQIQSKLVNPLLKGFYVKIQLHQVRPIRTFKIIDLRELKFQLRS